MSQSIGRALLVTLLCVGVYCTCNGQVFPTAEGRLPQPKEEIVSRTHDFSSAIAAHVRSSKQPEAKAKTAALLELFSVPPLDKTPVKRTEIRPGVFQVEAPESYHKHLEGLAQWMTDGAKQITIESRFLTVSEAGLRKLHSQFGANWEMTNGDPKSVEITADQPEFRAVLGPDFASFQPHPLPVLSVASSASETKQFLPCRSTNILAGELKRLVDAARSDEATNLIQAPKLTVFPGQEAMVSDTTQRPFVTSVKPSEIVGAAMQPVITVLEDGLKMRIKASVDEENNVEMETDVILSEIGDVDTFTFETPGKLNGTTVQIPKYTERKVSISKKLSQGQSLIIDPHFVTEKVTKRRFRSDVTTREYTIVILTARVIQQQPEQADPKVAAL